MQDQAANISIRSCELIDISHLHNGFCRAFSDYAVAMQPTIGEFRLMLTQRGFNETLSRVALCGRSVVSFWLLGTSPGPEDGSAYVIATGTAADFRGRGLARHLHHDLHQSLAPSGIKSVQLEVISGNRPARALYAKLGYLPVRDLSCLDIVHAAIKPAESVPTRIAECSLPDVSAFSQTCMDWHPSWQNDMASLARIPGALVCLAANINNQQVGYGILIKPTATIAQLAVRPDKRRAGIGSAVLQSLASASSVDTLRVVNADSRDSGFHAFLAHHCAQKDTTQVEMRLAL